MSLSRIPRVEVGDPITAELFNALASRLERFANLSVSGRSLRHWSSPTGQSLARACPQVTWARLSGDTSPYSFVEVREGPGGDWEELPHGDSGTLLVHEVNGKDGLDGSVVPIRWTSAGDWRFQWVGYGPPPPCETGRLCLSITNNGCSPSGAVHGAVVTWTNANGDVVGTCTTSGASPSACCIDLPAPGTYTASVKVPGLAPRTGSVDALCGQDNTVSVSFPASSLGTFCFSLTNCGIGVAGVEVTVSKPGEPDATAVTDGSGNACVSLGTGSGYSYSATYGDATASGPVTIFGCNTVSRSLSVITDYYFRITSSSDPRNNGCTGTFTLYRGPNNTYPAIFTQLISLSLFDGSGYISPDYHQNFSAIPDGTTVLAELLFPSGPGNVVFFLTCTGPGTLDNYGNYTGILCP